MRIAILGTRGIPASYGGFETFAEHLATRLVSRGHNVTVYCRAHYVSPRQLEYHGVRLRVLPTIRHKYFDTVVHAFLSTLHASPSRFDAALICNAANAPFASILRFTGTPVAINVDGLEHKRKKWTWLGRGYYLLAERRTVNRSCVLLLRLKVSGRCSKDRSWILTTIGHGAKGGPEYCTCKRSTGCFRSSALRVSGIRIRGVWGRH
jgi:glycosyltransferase involved in cell wall biosynthesis